MEQLIIPAIIAIVVAFFSVYGLTPFVIRALEKRNITVVDVNKKEKTMVPRPGCLSIIVGIESSLIILYIFFPLSEILAVILTTFFAFIVGLIDDKKTMGGWFKPLALAFCAAPILLLRLLNFGEITLKKMNKKRLYLNTKISLTNQIYSDYK